MMGQKKQLKADLHLPEKNYQSPEMSSLQCMHVQMSKSSQAGAEGLQEVIAQRINQ